MRWQKRAIAARNFFANLSRKLAATLGWSSSTANYIMSGSTTIIKAFEILCA